MKKVLALASILYSPMAFGMAVPKVLGILFALLKLGSNIGIFSLVDIFSSLIFFPGGFLQPFDFVFLL